MSHPESGRFEWEWRGTELSVAYERHGSGPELLLLPAFSTVSTRGEMRPLVEQLCHEYRCTVVDWPGFGEGRQPALRHDPQLHFAFLQAFTAQHWRAGGALLAAGHAAPYALALARERPEQCSKLLLLAPTWRGPLPTMMSGYRPLQERIHRAVRSPLFGPLLYRLNVSRAVIGFMYRRHVYADPAHLTADFIAAKTRIARQPGRRFGSGAFVTGALDLVRERSAFLALAAALTQPIMALYGEQTPPKSRAEMTALSALPGVQCRVLPHGTLGLYEEYPQAVAALARPFLMSGITARGA